MNAFRRNSTLAVSKESSYKIKRWVSCEKISQKSHQVYSFLTTLSRAKAKLAASAEDFSFFYKKAVKGRAHWPRLECKHKQKFLLKTWL